MRWIECGGRLVTGAAAAVVLSTGINAQQPTAPAQPTVTAPQSRFVVVVDAAHGGDDTGGHLNDGQLEKSATLAMSVRLRSLLSARGIQVVTTRESDQSLTPDQRADIANRARAQACISLHAAETGSGTHLFASSLGSSSVAKFMPWKTAQSSFVTRSLALAGVLNSALTHGGTPVTLGRTALPGIDSMACPAVVVELAPARDADKKTTSEPDDLNYQAQIAATLAAAILEWRVEGHQP
ncbi:N-acetylmuramoyl-L-alanine amidase [Acidobacteria bacterium AB60]|nr:N-acetylmuramoyl-L-alanine amidase [Acidobacteria bacterium AB60]